MRSLVCGLLVAVLAGCTQARAPTPDPEPSSTASSASASASEHDPDPVRPADFDRARAMAAVRYLAGIIGPRHGTSPAYRRAATWVEGSFRRLGYDVRRQPFDVPDGVSWGVPVPAGRSLNLLATTPGFEPTRPHLVVGAHLDTVPQAPGAEDNASGVGVLIAVADALAGRESRLPVLLVAFGAEEPRGPGDDDHHYGSRSHVAGLSAAARRTLRGMVSLDRVGVGTVLPVCSAAGPDRLRAELLAAARRADVPVTRCTDNRASDHWSFARVGLPGVRLGSTPYAAYHSATDAPSVVNRAQLERAGRTVLAWLSAG